MATDLNGRVIYWGKGAETLYEYQAEEVMGKPVTFIVEPEEKSEEQARMQQVREKGSWKGQYKQKCKNGRTFWADTVISLVIDKNGHPVGLIGIDRDITEQVKEKEARESLRRLAQKLAGPLEVKELCHIVAKESRTLFTHDAFWIHLLDGSNTRELVVEYSEDTPFGEQEPSEITTKTIDNFVLIEEPKLINRNEESSHSEFTPFGEKTRLSRSILFAPIRWENKCIGTLSVQSYTPNRYGEKELYLLQIFADQCSGAFARIQSQEKQKQLEAQMRQAQKMEAVGQLAGGVAHDFNNLLMIIGGYSDFALKELNPDNSIYKDINEIKKAGERASTLTRQLLAFSRKQILQLKVLNINELVANLEKMLRRLIGEDIELVTMQASSQRQIKADPAQLEQIIMNLAVNARDAMPHGGKLTIETANVELDEAYARRHGGAQAGSHVMLAMTDSGFGMDEETQKRIFEPFFTTKKHEKGTGLGLSTVYGIVKQSGGCIYVYSEPGKGATFKIYFPCIEEDQESINRKEMVTESVQGNETILLVEDEESVRNLVSRILHEYGYTVLEAANGEEAIEISQRQEKPIHLLLTDVVMPGISGRELSRRLTVLIPQFKTLFMSGYTDNAIVHHGVLESGLAFIQKPIETEKLLRKVREVLDT